MDNYNKLSWGHFKQLDYTKGDELKIVFSHFDRCILYTTYLTLEILIQKMNNNKRSPGLTVANEEYNLLYSDQCFKEKLCMTF